MRRGPGSWLLILIVCFMIGWPIYQITVLLQSNKHAGDATKLLYQVSAFQMELLNSFLSEAEKSSGTDQLNSLKEAVYSADFTHQRLVLAVGDNKLTPLKSLNELLQYIMRLQIGGNRTLQPGEIKVFQDSVKQFEQMYQIYNDLFSDGGRVYSLQNDKLKKFDDQLYSMLHGQLLK